MNRLRQVSAMVIAMSLVAAACTSSGGSAGTSYAAPTAPAGTAAPAASAANAGTVTIGTLTTSLGIVLTGPSGLTLYTHAGDGPKSSTCTGGCAAAWPPLTVSAGAQPAAGPGVTGKLGTFSRPDGTIQVTYNGLPLYYWTQDTKPGDTTGQGVGGFIVAKAAGSASASSAAGSSPAASGSGGYHR